MRYDIYNVSNQQMYLDPNGESIEPHRYGDVTMLGLFLGDKALL